MGIVVGTWSGSGYRPSKWDAEVWFLTCFTHDNNDILSGGKFNMMNILVCIPESLQWRTCPAARNATWKYLLVLNPSGIALAVELLCKQLHHFHGQLASSGQLEWICKCLPILSHFGTTLKDYFSYKFLHIVDWGCIRLLSQFKISLFFSSSISTGTYLKVTL